MAQSINAPRMKPPMYAGGSRLGGMLREFFAAPIPLLHQVIHEHPDIVGMRFGPVTQYILNDADYVKHVLQTNNRNYTRPVRLNKVLSTVSGLNLFTAEGDYWRRQRRLLQPAFHRQRIAGFGEAMIDETIRMLARWDERPDADAPLDIQQEMTALTLNIVGRTLFSVDMAATGLGRDLTAGIDELTHYINYRFRTLLPPPLFLPTPVNRRFKRARALVRARIQTIIDERRRSPGEQDDFLQMLLDMRYEDSGQGMSDEQLLDESMAFIFAGHETTANTLSWTLYLLATHPDVEAQLHAEVSQVLGERRAGVDDLPALPYTHRVIQESMRLYPAAWIITRQAIDDDQVGPYAVDGGTTLMVNLFGIHRHPRYWTDPDRFDPDRFTEARSQQRPRHAYLPFSEGPRLCIGNQFALMEAQLALATIVQRRRLRLIPGYEAVPQPVFTLRIRDGLPMRIENRE